MFRRDPHLSVGRFSRLGFLQAFDLRLVPPKVTDRIEHCPAGEEDDQNHDPGWNSPWAFASIDHEFVLIAASVGIDHKRQDSVDGVRIFQAVDIDCRTVSDDKRDDADTFAPVDIFADDLKAVRPIGKFVGVEIEGHWRLEFTEWFRIVVQIECDCSFGMHGRIGCRLRGRCFSGHCVQRQEWSV